MLDTIIYILQFCVLKVTRSGNLLTLIIGKLSKTDLGMGVLSEALALYPDLLSLPFDAQ